MKKIVLIVAFVFATGSIINATSSNKEYIKITSEIEEIYEDFGCARDCVDAAEEATYEHAVDTEDLPDMDYYMDAYENCYYSNCA